MTLTEWFNAPLYRDKPTPTAIQRYCELCLVNGGPRVMQWGIISDGPPPYGRTGLNQEEALELITLSGIVDGFCLADPQNGDRLSAAMKSEWERLKAKT